MQKAILYDDEWPLKKKVKHPPFRFIFGIDQIKEFFGDQEISLLDVGTGDGVFPRLFFNTKSVNASVVEANAKYRADTKKAGIKTYRSIDEVSSKFDVVTCFEVLEHQDEPIKLLKSMFSKLKKPGLLIFTVPFQNKCQDSDHKWYFDYYDIHSMASKVSKAFEIYLINKFLREERELNLFATVIYSL